MFIAISFYIFLSKEVFYKRGMACARLNTKGNVPSFCDSMTILMIRIIIESIQDFSNAVKIYIKPGGTISKITFLW